MAKSQGFGFSVPIPPASVDKMLNFRLLEASSIVTPNPNPRLFCIMLFERAKSQEFVFSIPIPPAFVDKMRDFRILEASPIVTPNPNPRLFCIMLFELAKSQEFVFSVPIPPASVDKMRDFPAFRSLPHSHSKSKFQTFLYNAFSHNKRGRRMFTLE